MGEAARRLSTTERFIKKFRSCCFCGGRQPATTREHMPPTALFDRSHRPNDLVMPACAACNSNTSTADLVASIISRWMYDSGPQERFDHDRLVGRLLKQAPELISEWTKFDPEARRKARLHLMSQGIDVPQNAGLMAVGPLTSRAFRWFESYAEQAER
jgi:hypothetical protein